MESGVRQATSPNKDATATLLFGFSVNANGLGSGFAPRHLDHSILPCKQMSFFAHFHSNSKICILLLLFSVSLGCQSNRHDPKVNELVREANLLIEQDAGLIKEWGTEYQRVFSPENRAGFPSNREMLRSYAENQIRLLEQQAVLRNGAADKFEQASNISNNEKEKKFTSLFAASFRIDAEITQLFTEQMKLFFDDNIKDSKTFETKFMQLTQSAEAKIKERDELQSEGKRILGHPARS